MEPIWSVRNRQHNRFLKPDAGFILCRYSLGMTDTKVEYVDLCSGTLIRSVYRYKHIVHAEKLVGNVFNVLSYA